MVDRIRWDTVSYLPFYYIFFTSFATCFARAQRGQGLLVAQDDTKGFQRPHPMKGQMEANQGPPLRADE